MRRAPLGTITNFSRFVFLLAGGATPSAIAGLLITPEWTLHVP